MAEIASDPIMRIAMGFMAAKHLFVASEIGVFENLADGPATLDELSAKSGIPHRSILSWGRGRARCELRFQWS